MVKMDSFPQFFLDNNTGNINTHPPLNILVIGKVSTGKSSLLNSLLGRSRKNSPFKVRAESGVTQTLEVYQVNPYLRLIDAPGLDDITKEERDFFLYPIDIGILVVEGSADARQKSYLDRLREHCPKVVVVLNKIDQFDKWQPFVLERVIKQWQDALDLEQIFPTCTFGFDPELDFAMNLDLRGIEPLKAELENLLRERWQQKYRPIPLSTLVGIVSPTIRSISEAGNVPRRSPFIPGLLAIALVELYYQYHQTNLTGEQVYQILQRVPQIGFAWQKDNQFLLAPDRLRLTIIDSLDLLLGAIEQWSQGRELGNLSRKELIERELGDELPTNWTKPIEVLLQKVLSLPC